MADASVHPSLALTVLYGTLGAVSVSLGKGFQKYGVEVLAHPRQMLTRRYLFKTFVWLLGTSGLVASAFFIFAACAYGPLTVVGALSGTGLVALVLFSVLVLKEPFSKTEMAGIVAIIIGTVLSGYFEGYPKIANFHFANPDGLPFNTHRVAVFGAVVACISFCTAIYSWKTGYRHFGVIFGSISGFCGGISVFFQKGAMMVCNCSDIFADIPSTLKNPFFYLFAMTGIFDFIITQYALTRSKAVTVVPCYQSFYMTIPIVGGIVAYYDGINLLQFSGLILLLFGVILLSMFIGKGEENPPSAGVMREAA